MNLIKKVFFIYFLIFSFISLNNSFNITDISQINLEEFTKLLQDPEIQKHLNIDINKYLNKGFNPEDVILKGTEMLTQKCLNASNGDTKVLDNLITEAENLSHCLQEFINVTELEIEIEEHSKDGSLEIVFNKYCKDKQILLDCIDKFALATEGCLEGNEFDKKKLVMRLVNVSANFICYKDGDHIALFIADGGPECFKEHSKGLQICAEDFLKKFFIDDDDDLEKSIKNFKFNQSTINCNDIDLVQQCMVDLLAQCENTTPANLMDSTFRQMKKECKYHVNPELERQMKGTAHKTTTAIIFNTIILTIFAKILS